MVYEWQPIETAPKNKAGEMVGPAILIYSTFDGFTWPTFWGALPESETEGGWLCCDGDGHFPEECVTHWMPLPPDPDA